MNLQTMVVTVPLGPVLDSQSVGGFIRDYAGLLLVSVVVVVVVAELKLRL